MKMSSFPWEPTRNNTSDSSRLRDLNMSAIKITGACRFAIVGPNDAMILPYDANRDRMEFSEGTGDIPH
jgi:hypothetical protein